MRSHSRPEADARKGVHSGSCDRGARTGNQQDRSAEGMEGGASELDGANGGAGQPGMWLPKVESASI